MAVTALDGLLILGRTTLWLSAAVIGLSIVLRLAGARSPVVHRAAWLAALLVGWSFVRLPIAVTYSTSAPPTVEAPAAAPDEEVLDELPPLESQATELPLVDTADATLPPLPPETTAETNLIELTEEIEPTADVEMTRSLRPIDPAPRPKRVVKPAPNWATTLTARLRAIDWPRLGIATWCLGIVAIVFVWTLGYLRFARRASRFPLPAGELAREWRDLLAARKIEQEIPLRLTGKLGPMLCRLPRGYVLLVPEALWKSLGQGDRLAILRHELAHYERGDLWKSLVVRALALPHWFNPLAWLAARRFEDAAEWACDAIAAASQPASYAKALLQLGQCGPGQVAYGTAARGRTLASRIRRILSGAGDDSRLKKGACLAALSIGLALALVRIDLVAQQAPAAPSTATEPGKKAEQQQSPAASERKLQPLDVVALDVNGTPPDRPLHGQRMIDPDGEIVLGGGYGRAKIGGLTRAQAEQAVLDHLGNVLASPAVQLSRIGRQGILPLADFDDDAATLEEVDVLNTESDKTNTRAAYNRNLPIQPAPLTDLRQLLPIRPGMFLRVSVVGTPSESPIDGDYVVEPDGTIALGANYGRGQAGKTNKETEQRIRKHLEQLLASPEVTVDYAFPRAKPERLANRGTRGEPQAQQPAQPPPANESSVAAQARRTYEAMYKAWLAGRRSLSEVCEWSKRWRTAAENAQSSLADKRAAATAHLDRLKRLRDHVAKLHAAGERGGEIENLTEIDYYLADAEQWSQAVHPVQSLSPPQGALRYKDKTFDEWVAALDAELSPEQLKQALQAFSAFASRGLGRKVAETTIAKQRIWSQSGDNRTLRAEACALFQKIPSDVALPALEAALKAGDQDQRAFAAEALVFVDAAQAIPLLKDLLHDKEPSVRAFALSGLARRAPHDSQVGSVANELLSDSDPRVVVSAADALLLLSYSLGDQSQSGRRTPQPLIDKREQLADLLVDLANNPETIGDPRERRRLISQLEFVFVRMGADALPVLLRLEKLAPAREANSGDSLVSRIRAAAKQQEVGPEPAPPAAVR